ncbi:AAA family ATPase [Chamaesiphon minutus]|uniref:Putative kinase n=1 Tax=Chamaesiphon minutus (strain ATCC 27169 / PCC 6605) TaxID=1173020 RepID=K9UE65_CHAP6|nr:ATP-binding protein [Chamaesiphon minutus]AFY92716.1 putative kinase [Chamaesiphon minutus PCC 6605]
MTATLHLLHGFTGAGKTTFARKLERELSALRFTPDEWIVQLYGHNPPEENFLEYYNRVTDLIWQLTMQVLQSDRDVILDFGFWSRSARDEARSKAQVAGANVKLYSISCSEEIMHKRVLKRSAQLPTGALLIDENAIELFKASFESLDEDESHTIVHSDAR